MTAPTHYSVQPFGLPQPPQGLSLQLQAPVVARTINIAGQSQLNKSAMPFKPAQQQQNTLQVGVPLLVMRLTIHCRCAEKSKLLESSMGQSLPVISCCPANIVFLLFHRFLPGPTFPYFFSSESYSFLIFLFLHCKFCCKCQNAACFATNLKTLQRQRNFKRSQIFKMPQISVET